MLSMDESIHKELKFKCFKEGFTMNSFIISLIEKELKVKVKEKVVKEEKVVEKPEIEEENLSGARVGIFDRREDYKPFKN